VHLKDLGQLVAREIEAAGGVAKEFNTIAVDDGIAMGHDGMLYSLPSREIIADSVEYMVNAHCADALVCISNCDKITPGMLMAAMRLNIPVVFVSGGPMEAGKVRQAGRAQARSGGRHGHGRRRHVSDADGRRGRALGLPHLRLLLRHVHRQLHELPDRGAGPGLPGNGTVLATHADRKQLFERRVGRIVELAKRYYEQDDATVLPRSIASFKPPSRNAMTLDIAMGGSTNTMLHLLAAAQEAECPSPWPTSTGCRARCRSCARWRPTPRQVPHGGRAPRRRHHGHPGRARPRGLLHTRRAHGHAEDLGRPWTLGHHARNAHPERSETLYRAGPGGIPTQEAFSQSHPLAGPGSDRATGCIRDIEHAYSKEGGLAVLRGNIALDGCVVKTAGIDESMFEAEALRYTTSVPTSTLRVFRARAGVREPRGGGQAILDNQIVAGDVVVIRYEGPRGGPGMQEMLYPTSYLKSKGPGKGMRPADRRPLLRRHLGAVDRPCVARGRRGWRHRAGA
jgi:dihydroxy-acid dehydratase